MGAIGSDPPLPNGDARSVLLIAHGLSRQVVEARDHMVGLIEGLEKYLHEQIINQNNSELGGLSAAEPLPGPAARSALQVTYARVQDVLEASDRVDERVDDLAVFLRSQFDNAKVSASSFGVGPGRPGPPLARYLEIVRHPDGSASIFIDEEKPFWLPAGMADFLERLASDDGRPSDMFVPWKPRRVLREWLQQQRTKGMRAQYVNQLVHRLRGYLKNAGIKRNLIHTHDLKGVRFALLRGRTRLVRSVDHQQLR